MDGLAKAGRIDEAKSLFHDIKERSIRSGMFSVRDCGLRRASLNY